jgi:hypothetical protein
MLAGHNLTDFSSWNFGRRPGNDISDVMPHHAPATVPSYKDLPDEYSLYPNYRVLPSLSLLELIWGRSGGSCNTITVCTVPPFYSSL